MIEILQIITNILVCIFCLSGWIFFSEVSQGMKHKRKTIEQAIELEKILAQMNSERNKEDKDA
tara:strand:+ start:3783 stop:3971 length:189 start_codon:yes stop_codon:yes gene_type:complete